MIINFTIDRKRGDTEETIISIKENKKLKDITGHSFVLSVNKLKSPVLDDYLFTIEGRIINASEGKLAFDFDETNSDFVGSFYFDIEMTKPDGKIRTIAEGDINFTQDISK